MKRYLLAALAAAALGGSSLAQDAPAPLPKKAPANAAPTTDDLKKKYEDKLAQPFLKLAPWITDYDKAREESKKSGKPIFGYFSRSYAY
ncbi:MAG: hypothetical protein HY286_08960 [Planctomycetes bacterium]|nr:hypothetical protein [Planctomycetota bacterium]